LNDELVALKGHAWARVIELGDRFFFCQACRGAAGDALRLREAGHIIELTPELRASATGIQPGVVSHHSRHNVAWVPIGMAVTPALLHELKHELKLCGSVAPWKAIKHVRWLASWHHGAL
jgi:hypothetical protein